MAKVNTSGEEARWNQRRPGRAQWPDAANPRPRLHL